MTSRHKLTACFLTAHLLGLGAPARARAGDQAPPTSTKEEAKQRFDRGLGFYRQKQLEAALAEFVLSRKLFPTRAASFNAALVYRELARHDEALEVLESIPREFSELSAADKEELDRQVREVKARVGYLVVTVSEPDATVVIDGRERAVPQNRTLAVSAGTHVVRAHKDGFLPFETRIDVAAQVTMPVNARLGALTRGGRLAVVEDRGASVSVLVDGIQVGKTPWEGTVAVGSHTIALRGDSNVGSPPTPFTISLNQLTKISLVAEPLACAVRVEPTPRTAHVAVDGVDVGRGVWEGALRCGGHQLEVGGEGFLSRSRAVTLREGPTMIARESLERDPTSAIWQSKNPPRITVEGTASGLVSPGFGGELGDTCTEGCSASPALGASVMARAGYRLGIGLGASIDAGVLYTAQGLEGRATETRPYGLPAHAGRADDDLRLSGPMLGGSLSYTVGDRFPLLARFGAGALLASFSDSRSGAFSTTGGVAYTLPSTPQSFSLSMLYLDPELRIGYRIFRGGILELGVRGLIVVPLGSRPRWGDETELSLGTCPSQDRAACSGRGVYAPSDLVGSTLVFVGPSIGFRGEL